MKIGNSLKELRLKAKFSQKDLAYALNITQSYLSKIENNDKEPSTALIKAIGDYFKIPYAIVLWGAIEETDIVPEKRQQFNNLKPLVDCLLSQLN